MKKLSVYKNLNRVTTCVIVIVLVMLVWNINFSLQNDLYYYVSVSKDSYPVYSAEKVLKDGNGSIYIKSRNSNSIEIFDSKGEHGGSIYVSFPFDFKIDENSILTLAVLEATFEDKNKVWVSKEYFFCNDVHNISETASDGADDEYKGTFDEYLKENGYTDAQSVPYKQYIGSMNVDGVKVSYPIFPLSSTVLLIVLCMDLVLKIFFRIIIRKLKKLQTPTD